MKTKMKFGVPVVFFDTVYNMCSLDERDFIMQSKETILNNAFKALRKKQRSMSITFANDFSLFISEALALCETDENEMTNLSEFIACAEMVFSHHGSHTLNANPFKLYVESFSLVEAPISASEVGRSIAERLIRIGHHECYIIKLVHVKLNREISEIITELESLVSSDRKAIYVIESDSDCDGASADVVRVTALGLNNCDSSYCIYMNDYSYALFREPTKVEEMTIF